MSLLQHSDMTRINRLTVRGPTGTRQRLLPQLESGQWPVSQDGSWVLVRQVAASGDRSHLADKLLEKTRQQVSRGDPSEVIRFPSLAALVAALVTDLSRGVAHQRWYWRRWSHLWPMPAGDAIQQLLQEHPRQVVAICHFLASSGNLTRVWRHFSADNGRGVVATLGGELGLKAGSLGRETLEVRDTSPTIQVSDHHVQAWQPVLAALPETDPRSTLAALIIATDVAALALRAEPDATLAAIRRKISEPAPKSVARHTPVAARRPATEGTDMAPLSGQAPASSTEFVETQASQVSPSAAVTQQEARHKAASLTRENEGVAETNPDATDDQLPDRSPLDDYPALDTNPDALRTEMGGALYLLNVLNRPAIQAIMELAWPSLPSGWAWLYRLARELDLNTDDTLCGFLAERLGLESAEDLESLPELPERQAIVSLAGQWFRHEDIWGPSLLRMPAELTYTPGHLDLYTDNSQVQLALRLAGLDFNPGWLPWLGTVVTFHFDHFPHLQNTSQKAML